MQNLLRLEYEKILLLAAVIFRGDYRGALGDILREQEKEANYEMGHPDDPPGSLTGEEIPEPKLTKDEDRQVKAIETDIFDAVERAVDEAGF